MGVGLQSKPAFDFGDNLQIALPDRLGYFSQCQVVLFGNYQQVKFGVGIREGVGQHKPAGIARLFYQEGYSVLDGEDVLAGAGVEIIHVQ